MRGLFYYIRFICLSALMFIYTPCNSFLPQTCYCSRHSLPEQSFAQLQILFRRPPHDPFGVPVVIGSSNPSTLRYPRLPVVGRRKGRFVTVLPPKNKKEHTVQHSIRLFNLSSRGFEQALTRPAESKVCDIPPGSHRRVTYV